MSSAFHSTADGDPTEKVVTPGADSRPGVVSGFLASKRFSIIAAVVMGAFSGCFLLAVIVARSTEGRYLEQDLSAGELSSFEGQAPPRGIWVAIDSDRHTLKVYRGHQVLRQAVCSIGSGVRLIDQAGGREWVFETPVGLRTVQRKVRDPVWVKPDWAFIEEGEPPPPLGSRERYDDVSLGDYALYLGDGYLIHGTLFQSLLGQSVTHGCIRLGDEDLEYVFHTVPIGARVYLF